MQDLKCRMQNLKRSIQSSNSKFSRKFWQTFCFLLFAFCIGCSIPNLEKAECTESRGIVKEFYSYHFGNEMKFSEENLKQREKFLSPELTKLLQKFVTDSDPFTLTTNDEPKAFSVSGCQATDEKQADVRILLFWRDEERTEQREIHVQTVKQNDKWLINNIYNDQANLQNNLNH